MGVGCCGVNGVVFDVVVCCAWCGCNGGAWCGVVGVVYSVHEACVVVCCEV